MAKFDFKVVGAHRVANSLRTLAATNKNVIEPVMVEWAQSVRSKLKGTRYPAKRPNQKYRRTGRLANSWAVQKVKAGIVKITNRARQRNTFYASFVIGDSQAWMHKGRWWKANDVINEETGDLVRMLSDRVEELF